MTNAELLAKIKAEIERLKAKYRKDMYKSNHEGLASGYKIEAYNELLSFLSTLESEKPVPNDIEEAAVDIADALLAKPKDYVLSAKADYWNGAHDGIITGAKWKKEQMISALKNDGDLPIEFIDKFHEIDRTAFQNGQANMRKQMMKEAVEGEYGYFSNASKTILPSEKLNIKEGDKVRIIVLPKKD